ncbi:MAG: SDR family NAD(P)-dependent oxidoreductase [Anaerolineales bacterium]|nr:SDR family NAD(P)-dependent oxidoreductase [Anaerolineales bacterium]
MHSLKDKVVLITGAGRGAGRSIALSLASQGAIIAANDISPVNLDDTVRLISQSGGKVKDYVIDISKKMPVQRLINTVLDDWSRIDILINYANVEPTVAVMDIDEWDMRRTIDVNLVAPILTTQIVGRVMKESGGGTIINVIHWKNHEKKTISFASKVGLLGFTHQVVQEYAPNNIYVFAVCKGLLDKSLLYYFSSQNTVSLDKFPDIPSAVVHLCKNVPQSNDHLIYLSN